MLGRSLTGLLKHRSKQQVAESTKLFGRRPRQQRNRKARFELLERRDLLSVEPALAGLFGAFGSHDYGTSGAEGEYSPATAPVATPMVQYRLALYDTNDQPLPLDASGNATISVGEDFRLVGYHRDITYDASDFVGEGVYAAYVDIFHTNAHHLMVRHGETQQLEFYRQVQNVAIQGTFTLTFDGHTTAEIDYNTGKYTLASNIQNALADLPNIGPGNVRVTPAPSPDDPPPGIQPNAFRVDFLNELGERDVPMLELDSSQLTELSHVVIQELFTAELDNPGTFRNSFTAIDPFVEGFNAEDREQLDPDQPLGGSLWGNVGGFPYMFSQPNPAAEFAFFSVDIRAIAPGRIEFSASAPDIEQDTNHGFETLVFPTIKETQKLLLIPTISTSSKPLTIRWCWRSRHRRWPMSPAVQPRTAHGGSANRRAANSSAVRGAGGRQ